MEPVINPMFFYFLSIADSVNIVFGLILAITSICMLGFCIFMICAVAEQDEDMLGFIKKSPLKRIFAGYIVVVFAFILMPAKETLIEMEVAKNITYDRLDKVVEIGKDLKTTLKSDVIDIIKAINKEAE